ncbi:hypothetical protein F5148DRAFT_196751 [Russula earlei]|uniref:Uncharacterized protein n=1 Tax=Russula earlei TaxID=71964 RepID=A0ACC0U546_9AGAM|nr:hypothetical protein F5148DRAFT_196751 [Russula earlei]
MDPVTAETLPKIFARPHGSPRHRHRERQALPEFAASQSGARDLASTVWNILDLDLDETASIINLVVDFIVLPTSASMDYASGANSHVLNAHRLAPPK